MATAVIQQLITFHVLKGSLNYHTLSTTVSLIEMFACVRSLVCLIPKIIDHY